jgi:Asp-tRNA(Asn)/Glu-tRNA(Gln) amidotransferase A subunit family amidase
MPGGFQLIGGRFGDFNLLRLARMIETESEVDK